VVLSDTIFEAIVRYASETKFGKKGALKVAAVLMLQNKLMEQNE
jgi:hypothetical protein